MPLRKSSFNHKAKIKKLNQKWDNLAVLNEAVYKMDQANALSIKSKKSVTFPASNN